MPVSNPPDSLPLAGADGPSARKLEAEDRLRVENLYLRLQNTQLHLQQLEYQKLEAAGMIKEQQQQIAELLAALSDKYGTPIHRATVSADGTILSPPRKLGPSDG